MRLIVTPWVGPSSLLEVLHPLQVHIDDLLRGPWGKAHRENRLSTPCVKCGMARSRERDRFQKARNPILDNLTIAEVPT